ncbi:inositol monophosphatase family protein [Natronorubrum halophilum]|uniref:inositol monophosphatase family protein n=1 Tax=Natronorubrum halophilum TaxID=1702106 RepID=UPI000EF6616C|nr:inositol monophosphatase [Natronorubrum halophilum]
MSRPESDSETERSFINNARRRFLKTAGVAGAALGAGAGTNTAFGDSHDGDDEEGVIKDLEGQLPIDDQYLRIAVKAAGQAAQLHQNYFGSIEQSEEKDPQNLLTEVDTEAETLLRETIEGELGDDFEEEGHAIYGEEQGGGEGEYNYLWMLDPLDGTTNFIQEIPHFGVNIAVIKNDGEKDETDAEYPGELYAGVTYYSLRDEVWVAVKDKGAYKFESDGFDLVDEDSEPEELTVTETDTFSDALHGVGFYSKDTADDFGYMGLWRYLFADSIGTRLSGAAAPDIAFVADGQFDTCSVADLKEVDVAPGALIVREAGGTVTDFEGNDDLDSILSGDLVATNSVLHENYLNLYDAAGKDWLTTPVDALIGEVDGILNKSECSFKCE